MEECFTSSCYSLVLLANNTEIMQYYQFFLTQFLFINSIFDKYTLDTNILTNIIQSARLGEIHSSVSIANRISGKFERNKNDITGGNRFTFGFVSSRGN